MKKKKLHLYLSGIAKDYQLLWVSRLHRIHFFSDDWIAFAKTYNYKVKFHVK